MTVSEQLPLAEVLLTGEAIERRESTDRRRRPTPILSRYTFVGGKRRDSRRGEEATACFVDEWGAGLFGVVTCLAALNFLDAWFTIYLLSFGGKEMNPFIDAVIQLGCWPFIFVKSFGIGICVAILTLTSRFRIAKIGLATVMVGYTLLLFWHLYLLSILPS